MRYLVPDTSLLWNFHALGQIDLVGSFVSRPALAPSSAEWGLEVEQEVLRNIAPAHPALAEIFGECVMPTPAQRSTTQQIRENTFRETADDPRKHMGESEAIAIWSEKAGFGDHVLCLTEDRSFVRFCWRTHADGSESAQLAGGRRFVPVTTDDVLHSLEKGCDIASGSIPALVQRLRAMDRPYIGPALDFR